MYVGPVGQNTHHNKNNIAFEKFVKIPIKSVEIIEPENYNLLIQTIKDSCILRNTVEHAKSTGHFIQVVKDGLHDTLFGILDKILGKDKYHVEHLSHDASVNKFWQEHWASTKK